MNYVTQVKERLLFMVDADAVEQETIVMWLHIKVLESNIVPGAHVISI